MARIVKQMHDDHMLRMTEGDSELTLVGRGRFAYLWIVNTSPRAVSTFSGPVALRRLAHAILRTIPAMSATIKVGQVWRHPKYGTWKVLITTAKTAHMARCDAQGRTHINPAGHDFRHSTILRDFTLAKTEG